MLDTGARLLGDKDRTSADRGRRGGDDPLTRRRDQRVVPFVEDRRNCLLISTSTETLDATADGLACRPRSSTAIQVAFQLEDSELAAEPLPERRRPPAASCSTRPPRAAPACCAGWSTSRDALAGSPRAALEICHFDPDTGEDRRRAPEAPRGLRGGLLRLPAELRQPARPRAARPAARSRDLLLRAGRAPAETSGGRDARERARSTRCWPAADSEPRAALRSTSSTSGGYRLPDRRPARSSRSSAPGRTSSTTDADRASTSTARTTTTPTRQTRDDADRRRGWRTRGYAVRPLRRPTTTGTASLARYSWRLRRGTTADGGDAFARRLAGAGARPRVGGAARARTTTCCCCARSAAPTTRRRDLPAAGGDDVEPRDLRAARPGAGRATPLRPAAARRAAARLPLQRRPVPLARPHRRRAARRTSSCRC